MVSFHAASIFRSSIFKPQRRHSSRLKPTLYTSIYIYINTIGREDYVIYILHQTTSSSSRLPYRLSPEPLVDPSVHLIHLLGVRHLRDVDRLVPNLSAQHLDEAVLVIEAPIDGIGAQSQGFTNGLGLRVLPENRPLIISKMLLI